MKYKMIALMFLMMLCVLPVSGIALANDEMEQESLVDDEYAMPVYESIESWLDAGGKEDDFILQIEENGSERSVGVTTKREYRGRFYSNKDFYGYHPNFPAWQIVDAYYFSSKNSVSMSVSVSIAYEAMSLTIDVADEGNAGFVVSADRTRGASRVAIGGKIAVDITDIYIYDVYGNLVTTSVLKEFVEEESVLNYYVKYLADK